MIDRQALVARHAIIQRAQTVDEIDPRSPVSVGHGDFAATVDLTGLHTLPGSYPASGRYGEPVGTLLGMQSNTGWHTIPGQREVELEEAKQVYETARGPARYVDLRGSTSATAADQAPWQETWLRSNPHRLMLGMVGLADADGTAVATDRLSHFEQRHDLWTGVAISRFRLAAEDHQVETAAHAERLAVGWRVSVGSGVVHLLLQFPYGSEAWGNAADWDRADRHHTQVTDTGPGSWRVRRTLDTDSHVILLHAPGGRLVSSGTHRLVVRLGASGELTWEQRTEASGADSADPLSYEDLRASSEQGWRDYWERGGVVELAASTDPRAAELERRIVLSQYQLKVHSAGRLPAQETGLMVNSWWGRFHGEMHWWHVAHFALWGRPELTERSLGWYRDILPLARSTAAEQRLAGARWPKQTGPDARESPSDVGPFLIWQQPHPIFLAELVRRAAVLGGDAGDEARVIDTYAEVVLASAECMESMLEETSAGWSLGPPLIPAQESYGRLRREVRDPTFELAYWAWALPVAGRWADRVGHPDAERWCDRAAGLIQPVVVDGSYAAIGVPPWTIRTDHPSMLAALGFVPDTGYIDHPVMAATLDSVLADWDWGSTWGWDYPMMALCATRLGRPEQAVETLLAERGKNTYLADGHNFQTDGLPIYLPGNGGLLAAVAAMAAGWDGSVQTPGFGQGWVVRAEGLLPWPA